MKLNIEKATIFGALFSINSGIKEPKYGSSDGREGDE